MRILGLVLIAGALAALYLRGSEGHTRERAQARLETAFYRALALDEGGEDLRGEIDALVARSPGDAEVRWFAARLYLKLEDLDRAVQTVYGAPELATAPGTDRRFGDLVLRVAGYGDDERLARPTLAAPQALLALTDGEVEDAVEAAEQAAREDTAQAVLTFYEGLFAFTTPATNARLARALRARDLEPTRVVAALADLGTGLYPGRDEDLAKLIEIVRGPMRVRAHLVWTLACLALGRSEHPDAVAALASVVDDLAREPDERAHADRAIASAGLVAAGRWSATEAIEPYLGPIVAKTPVRHWYGEALRARIAREDPQATRYLEGLWASVKTRPEPLLLARLGQGLFLRDLPLPAGLDADALLADLEREEAGEVERVVAAAARYARDEAGARERLLDALRASARAGWVEQDPIQTSAFLPSPILIASRALLRHGGPAAAP